MRKTAVEPDEEKNEMDEMMEEQFTPSYLSESMDEPKKIMSQKSWTMRKNPARVKMTANGCVSVRTKKGVQQMAFTNQKRKINILQVISFIFLSMFLAFGPLCKIAFAAPGTGLLGIMANYSSEIEPRSGG